MNNSLIYKIFLNWKVKILDSTDPKTIEEFCERYKITTQEAKAFEDLPSFEDDFRKASVIWLQSKVPELLHIAYNEAKMSKSVSDIEKLVEIAHSLRRKGDKEGNQYNFFNLNDQQLKRIAGRLNKSTLGVREVSLPSGSSEE